MKTPTLLLCLVLIFGGGEAVRRRGRGRQLNKPTGDGGSMPTMDNLVKLASDNGLDKTNPGLTDQLKQAMAGVLSGTGEDNEAYEKRHGLTNLGASDDDAPMPKGPGGGGDAPPSLGAPPGLQNGAGDFGSFQAAANSKEFSQTGEDAQALDDKLDAEQARQDTIEANKIRAAHGQPLVPLPPVPGMNANDTSMTGQTQRPPLDQLKQMSAQAKGMGLDLGGLFADSFGKEPAGQKNTPSSQTGGTSQIQSSQGLPTIASLAGQVSLPQQQQQGAAQSLPQQQQGSAGVSPDLVRVRAELADALSTMDGIIARGGVGGAQSQGSPVMPFGAQVMQQPQVGSTSNAQNNLLPPGAMDALRAQVSDTTKNDIPTEEAQTTAEKEKSATIKLKPIMSEATHHHKKIKFSADGKRQDLTNSRMARNKHGSHKVKPRASLLKNNLGKSQISRMTDDQLKATPLENLDTLVIEAQARGDVKAIERLQAIMNQRAENAESSEKAPAQGHRITKTAQQGHGKHRKKSHGKKH